MNEQLALLPAYLTAHLQLTLLALLCSAAVSLPLGVAITRVRWLEQPALGVAGIIQTVPSLALLAVMVPLLAALGLQSIGFLPAFIGLTLYGVLPILRNTVTGIAGVDPALKEAARAVGMTPWQQLRRVELPLAMPVIVAGLRTATVWTVGIATLSTPVGATSLGNYIFSGLQTRNYTAVLVGCVAAAALAQLLDGLVHALEVGVRTRRRRRVGVVATAIAALYVYTGFTLAAALLPQSAPPVTVGAKAFTEQYILAHLLGQWVERETGRATTQMQSLGSMVAFDALTSGDIDIYVDYSGTLWANEMGRNTVGMDRATVLAEVGAYLADAHGIQVAATLGFENAYAVAARAQDAEAMQLTRISDLTRLASGLSMGGDYEFFSRPEWVSIRDTYGLAFAEQRTMDPALMYQAAAEGAVDLISAFTTDGRISAYDLRVLEDDRAAIPPYDALILVSARLVRQWPDVLAALTRLEGTIDVNAMRRMNLEVDVRGADPSAVAADFIRALGDHLR
ncbi:MAG: ABC transporter permease/substrate-binding protein [Vicinamibacterales bacterium]|jgi:osmoprotectant transport system permease protein|nr:ABC transporter permease/substrate-binding protein [Vicinamibacterales bacterium]